MKNTIKLLIFANTIEGGTGTFLLALRNINKYSIKPIEIKFCILQQSLFRSSIKDAYYFDFKYPSTYRNIITTALILLKELIWLHAAILKFQPTIIISIDGHCNLLTSLYKTLITPKIKTIITFHNNPAKVIERKVSKNLKRILSVIERIFLKNSDACVGVSDELSLWLKFQFNLTSVYTIHYGINLENVRKLAKRSIRSKDKKLFQNGNKTIISIGRLDTQKDFSTLLSAFKLVHERKVDSQLVVIGDGDQKKALISLTHKLGIEKNVYWLGWIKNPFPYLKRSDLFVLSTNYEGFPYVLLEAMTQKLPIIATNAKYGINEMLSDGKYGVLVPVKDPEGLALKVNSTLKNKEECSKLRKLSLARCKLYTEEKMLTSYSKL